MVSASGIPSVCPIIAIRGIKINAATVCETNVATIPANERTITNESQTFERGNAEVESSV